MLRRRAGAERPADDEHPFGYANRRYFWAFIVALVLFSLGGLFAIYEGIEKLRHPHELENIGLAIGMLRVRDRARAWSFRTALVETEPGTAAGRRSGASSGDTKSPELPVVLLEDTGALIGLGDRAVRRDHGARHRRAPLGRGRQPRDRHPARRDRALPRQRDGEPAARRSRDARGHRQDPRRDRGASHVSCRIIHLRTEHIGPEEIVSRPSSSSITA